MAKLMCKKCGGKMAKGGSTSLKYGIPQTGTTNYSAPTMQKGGSTKNLKKAQLGAIVKNIGGGGLIGTGIAAGLTRLLYLDKDIRNKNKVEVNKNKVKVNANKVKVNANKQ